MYKIFSKLLYNRIAPILLRGQSHDQHAFTPDVRIEDALLCAEIIIGNAQEFELPLWLLSMDLRKAFDSINHRKLFQALALHGLDEGYIFLIRLLYANQTASVNGSRIFDIFNPGLSKGTH